jgi:hypothetical protein
MQPSTAILIGAAGTWAVAFMALFGDRVRSWLFKPKLSVVPEGLSGLVKHGEGHMARYYLVSARNPTRFPMAHNAQLVLTRVEQPDAAGKPYLAFNEILPLAWQRDPTGRLLTRTIGPKAVADLFFVQDDGLLQLPITPAVTPNHFPAVHKGNTTLWMTLQAVADEADSPPVRFRIDYNGQWHAGEAEMGRNVTVSIE